MRIEARFYETYDLCAVVSGVLNDRWSHLRKLEGFHCDGQWAFWARPYEKYSVLHQFIEFIVLDVHQDQAVAVDLDERRQLRAAYADIPEALKDLRTEKLPIEEAFEHHDLEHQSFLEFLAEAGKTFEGADDNDVFDFMAETRLQEPYGMLIRQTVREVFHVLFQNRELLLTFNHYLSDILGDANPSEMEEPGMLERFTSSGTLLRVKPPAWARRAVFFRDHGRCVLCNADLSGLLNPTNIENYDHIVPLARHGINDVSNLQLLCVPCNQKEKRDRAGMTSCLYQSWYPYDTDPSDSPE